MIPKQRNHVASEQSEFVEDVNDEEVIYALKSNKVETKFTIRMIEGDKPVLKFKLFNIF